jgi:hypothetical protein
MKHFVIRNNLYLLTALAVFVGLYVAMNWSAMPVLQRLVGLFFIGITFHVWEEFRFPGGFAEMIMSRLNFAIADMNSAKMIVVTYVLYLAFVPLFFPHIGWLAMPAMLLGVLEVVGHLAMIKMFRLKRFYSPGLVTAAVVLLPISIYGISFVAQNHLVQPWEWLWALFYMIVGLVIAQATVVRMNGLKYAEFLKRLRSTLFARQD